MASKGVGDGDQSWWGEDEQDVQGKNGICLLGTFSCRVIYHMYNWNVLVY